MRVAESVWRDRRRYVSDLAKGNPRFIQEVLSELTAHKCIGVSPAEGTKPATVQVRANLDSHLHGFPWKTKTTGSM